MTNRVATTALSQLCTLRGGTGDWTMVAVLRAEAFFDSPSLAALRAPEAAAAQADQVPAVCAAALHYLETGQLPQRVAHSVGETGMPAWPLPETGIPAAGSQDEAKPLRRYTLQFPQLGLLIELAKALRASFTNSEGRPAEALHWYDRRGSARYAQINDDTVADVSPALRTLPHI